MKKALRVYIPLFGLLVSGIFLIHRAVPSSRRVVHEFPALATVRSVIDGDTIELDNGRRLRYIGIDTPELSKNIKGTWRRQPEQYGIEAQQANESLVLGKTVSIEYDVTKTDNYDRLLAYVYVENRMINLVLIEQGCAFVYLIPPNMKYKEQFLAAQHAARVSDQGIWRLARLSLTTPDAAGGMIRRLATIRAPIRSLRKSRAVIKLFFDNSATSGFTAVVFSRSADLFPLPLTSASLPGTLVTVIGMIKEFQGQPEIIINTPEQLLYAQP
jgi:micrococcal nuclease